MSYIDALGVIQKAEATTLELQKHVLQIEALEPGCSTTNTKVHAIKVLDIPGKLTKKNLTDHFENEAQIEEFNMIGDNTAVVVFQDAKGRLC